MGIAPFWTRLRPSECQGVNLSGQSPNYNHEQRERLRKIHARLIEARRELDALIGDAYLRPRASIVPVHFLDLASAVEKLRWAEKEWRELDRELAQGGDRDSESGPRHNPGREADGESEPNSIGLAEAVPSHSGV